MSRFTDKVALVTGGGTGIGKASALAIVAEGGKAVVVGRREEPLAALAKEHPDHVRYIALDVTSDDGPKRAVDYAVEQFGRLDVLVNNAGVAVLGPIAELGDKGIDALYDINVKAVLRLTREALPALVKTGGSVVNISSTLATGTAPYTVAYSGTKAALDHITRGLAAELGPAGVRVNAVAPGLTATDMGNGVDEGMRAAMVAQTPLGRIGTPEDIAKAVAFLASDDASWITGQSVQSSGGLML